MPSNLKPMVERSPLLATPEEQLMVVTHEAKRIVGNGIFDVLQEIANQHVARYVYAD